MPTLVSRLRRVGAWILMLDLRDRAVRQRDRLGWAFVQGLLAITALSAILGLGEGSRWELAIAAVVILFLGRLILWQNIRSGTKWRSRLYGGDDKS